MKEKKFSWRRKFFLQKRNRWKILEKFSHRSKKIVRNCFKHCEFYVFWYIILDFPDFQGLFRNFQKNVNYKCSMPVSMWKFSFSTLHFKTLIEWVKNFKSEFELHWRKWKSLERDFSVKIPGKTVKLHSRRQPIFIKFWRRRIKFISKFYRKISQLSKLIKKLPKIFQKKLFRSIL